MMTGRGLRLTARAGRAAGPALAALLALGAGCAGTGESPAGDRAAAAAPDDRVVFAGMNWTTDRDREGKAVPAATVRVRAADGKTRTFVVKPGQAIGAVTPEGDFRTGLLLVRIEKGMRPIKMKRQDGEMTALVDSFYLTARDASGREAVYWLAR